jgi:hypothetical protein
VFLLAQRTGWSIEYILWEVPLSLLAQSSHAYLWANGVNCRRQRQADGKELKELEAFLGLT